MHVLCPHCRNPIEMPRLAAGEEVTCQLCGSSFTLDGGSTTGYAPSEGRRVGRFELIEVVGQGAFGTVYKARDPELDRVVAVKVPRTGSVASQQERDRFLREARSAAQLRHPSIVSVHEVGQGDEGPYLVSDFMAGVTLTDLLSARRPGFREAAELIATIAEALQYAHERGVVHRDVKPSNVMISADGKPVVMDFGLAKRDAGEVTMTVEGQVLGTPAYMPPEQARGEGHRVDARGDVYSLGVVLYQLLTGELPFRGTVRMLLHQVLHDEPKAPRSLNDRIPRDLETIALKAMAKEPGRRFASAQEMADDLRRWLAGEPIRARPVGAAERAVRWARRNPTGAGLLGVSALAALAVVGLGVGLGFYAQLTTAHQSEKEARQAEEAERAKAEQALGDAERAKAGEEVERKKAEAALALADRVAYLNGVTLADRALKENNIPLARQQLASCKPGLRNWEWYYLQAQCHGELYSVPGHTGVFTADGGRVVVWDYVNPSVRIHDARTGRLVATVGTDGNLSMPPELSPDGSRLAVADRDSVRVYDVRTGKEQFVLRNFSSASFSPDGASIACNGHGTKLTIVDARTGADRPAVKGLPSRGGPTFSPDGRSLAMESDGKVDVYDVRSGEKLDSVAGMTARQLRNTGLLIDCILFSPDGSLVVVWDNDNQVQIRNVKTRKPLPLTGQMPVPPAFSPDNSRVAVAAKNGTVSVLDARTGQVTLTLKGPQGLSYPAFSPDGSRIAAVSYGGVVSVFDARTGEEVMAVKGTQPDCTLLFTPDGARIAVLAGNLVKVYDARQALDFRTPDRWPAAPNTFSPDWHRYVSWNQEDGFCVHNNESGAKLAVLDGVVSVPRHGFSPDGKRLVGMSRDREIRVCDAQSGRLIYAIKGVNLADLFGYLPTGIQIVGQTTDDAQVRFFDAATGQETHSFRLPQPGQFHTFSPDGSRIGFLMDNKVEFFDSRTGTPAHAHPVKAGVSPFTFSRDEARYAGAPWAGTAENDGSTYVYDLASGKELVLKGRGASGTAAFSADGTRIAVANSVGTMQLYDSATGQEVLSLKLRLLFRLVPSPYRAQFSPTGRELIASDSQTTDTLVYDAPADVTGWQSTRRDAVHDGLPAWHWSQAGAYDRADDRFAAAFHWGRLARIDPATGQQHLNRGYALAHLRRTEEATQAFAAALARTDLTPQLRARALAMSGQYAEAARVMAKAVEHPRARPTEWLHLALLRLHLGDRPGYQQTCATLLKQFGRFSDPETTEAVARACSQAPDAVPDWKPAVGMVRVPPRDDPNHYPLLACLGVVLYRSGKPADAVPPLLAALTGNGHRRSNVDALFLAMAYHRLGKHAEAKQHLLLAQKGLDANPPVDWEDRLTTALLRREAETLLGATK